MRIGVRQRRQGWPTRSKTYARRLGRVSPLAVPVLLDIGRETVRTAGDEDALLAETEALIAEATGDAEPSGRPMRVKLVHRANLAILKRKPRAAGHAG